MLVNILEITNILQDPANPTAQLKMTMDGKFVSELVSISENNSATKIPLIHGQPILIDFENSVIERNWFEQSKSTYSHIGKRRNLPRKLKGALFGTERISKRNFKIFQQQIKKHSGKNSLVLMIGAATPGVGSDILYDDTELRQIAFDIYPSDLTNFIADAHQLPLKDSCIDAVCIQAVLEHVLDPHMVVSEVQRVLKPGGLVYSETPFMQQVHEGAYDYTRFTELGHRWLWREFESIERGTIGGPGVSAYWAMKYLMRGLVRNHKLGDILSVPFGFFALFDQLIPQNYAIDGANGSFFIGQKSTNKIKLKKVVDEYLGAQIER